MRFFVVFIVIFAVSMQLSVAEDCMDYLLTCHEMVHLCEESNIKSECPYTCGACVPDPSVCKDRNPDCPTFSFMCFEYKTQCPKTCGVCTSDDINGTTKTTVTPKPASTVTLGTVIPILKTTELPAASTKVTVPQTKTTTKTTTTVTPTTVPKTTVKPTLHPTTKKPVPTTPKPPCKDSSPNCPTWAKNGFCTNTFYPPEQRKQYCAKTCKFC